MIRSLIAICIALMMIFLETGCMRWQSQFVEGQGSIDHDKISLQLEKATACSTNAANKDALWPCIQQFEEIVQTDVNNYQALIALGNLYLLWGDGYTQLTSEKGEYFRKAMRYCEQAMYTNPSFRSHIEAGETPWQAGGELTENEIDAMLFWVTAVFYYYKECLGPIGQMMNFRWIQRARTMLEKAEAMQPDWGGGIIYLSWGLYYLSVPEMVGGDRQKSIAYFNKAIATGPQWMMNRWARGRYYAVKMQDEETFLNDLQWVVAHDKQTTPDHMAWKHFFIEDAERLLMQKDVLFH